MLADAAEDTDADVDGAGVPEGGALQAAARTRIEGSARRRVRGGAIGDAVPFHTRVVTSRLGWSTWLPRRLVERARIQ